MEEKKIGGDQLDVQGHVGQILKSFMIWEGINVVKIVALLVTVVNM